MPMFRGPDCGLWVRVIGTGDPITVFAHGLTGTLEESEELAVHVAGTRVLFDLRGHGRSEDPPLDAGYGHDAIRRDIEAIADAYGATRAFGISVSAGALLASAAARPGRLERIGVFIPASIDEPNEVARTVFPREAEWLETMPLAAVAETIIAEAGAMLSRRPYWGSRIRERVLRMNAVGVPRALRAFVQDPPPVADASALANVRSPTLVLAHENDPLHDVAVARRLAALLPDARLRVWPDTLAMYDDLDGFARVIGAFFNGNEDP